MSTETKVLGITSGNKPPRIQYETEKLYLILPNYDFVAALYGPNTEWKILLEFRNHQIEISGQHLEILYQMLADDTVTKICAIPPSEVQANGDKSLCYVTDIFYTGVEEPTT